MLSTNFLDGMLDLEKNATHRLTIHNIYIYINIYWNILDIIWSRCSLRKWHTIEASWLEEKFCFCSKHHHMVGWFISVLKMVGNNRSTTGKYSGNSCRFSDLCWQSPTMLMVERKSSRISMRLSSSPLTDISSNWLGKYEGLKHHWRRDLSHTRVGLAWDTSPVRVHTTHALWATKLQSTDPSATQILENHQTSK